MQTSAPVPGDQLRPLLRLVRRAARFWWVGLATFALLSAGVAAFAVLRPKQYRSEAAVYYREGMQWTASEAMSPRRVGQRLRDMLLARAQLTKVIEDLGLYPELRRKGQIGEAVEQMRLATAFRFDQGDIFVISFTGRSPLEAQRVTAKLSDVLIGENARLRSQQAEVAREFLDAERKRKANELAEKEAAQLRFLARHPEFAQEQNATIGVTLRSRPRSGGAAAAPARNEGPLAAMRRDEERLRRQIAAPGQIPSAPPDPTLLAAKNEAEIKLRTTQRELADRHATLTEQHPDVRAAAAQAQEAEAAYKRAAQALEDTQKPVPVEMLRERLAHVQREIAAYLRAHPPTGPDRRESVEGNDSARRIVAVETEWAKLSREVSEARERHQQLDSQAFVASMTESMLTSGQTAQITIIDPAFLPGSPVGMRTQKLVLMGAALALVLALSVAIVLALLDDLIYDRVDLDHVRIAPVLAEVPRRSLPRPGSVRRPARAAAPDSSQLRAPPPDEDPPASIGDGAERLEWSVPLRTLPQAAEERSGNPRSPGGSPALLLAEIASPPPKGSPDAPRGTELLAQQHAASSALDLATPAFLGGATARRALALREAEARKPSSSEEEYLHLPSLVRVHRTPLPREIDPRLVMLATPDSPAAASFRILRHRLLERRGMTVVLVTSAGSGEGKTTSAANLALALAEGGRARVLLLEANFRTPSLARVLGFDPPACIHEQLELHRGDPTRPWNVVENVTPFLHTAAVKPSRQPPLHFDGQALAACIQDLRQSGYDHIVLDGPGILERADANVLEESVDGVLLTMWARRSHAASLRKAAEQLGSTKLLGIVLLGA